MSMVGRSRECKNRTGVHGDHVLNAVLELADVARPFIGEQRFHRLCRHDMTTAVSSQEVFDQVGDIVGAIAQRRQAKRDHIQTEVQVPAKGSLLHFGCEIAVRRRDDAEVRFSQLRGTDGTKLLLLQNAQKLRLKVQRQLSDLIEECGAAVRHLDEADFCRGGARERSLRVPEQLALHQGSHQRGAIHNHEWTRRAAAVKILRDYFLSCTGLSKNEDGPAAGANLLYLLEDRLDLG